VFVREKMVQQRVITKYTHNRSFDHNQHHTTLSSPGTSRRDTQACAAIVTNAFSCASSALTSPAAQVKKAMAMD